MSPEQPSIQPAFGQPSQGTIWSPPEVLQELAGEGDLIAELIETFTVDVAQRLERVRGAMTNADKGVLRAQVHAIKGSSKQMAAFQVATVCEQIEAAGESPVADLVELVALLERSVTDVCKAMEWYQCLASKRAS